MRDKEKARSKTEKNYEYRNALRGLIFGDPKTKALCLSIIEGMLAQVDIHSAQILELQSRHEPNEARFIDKIDGEYYCGGRPLKRLNKDTLYWVVFDTVFALMPNGGFSKYITIENELKKRRIKGRKLRSLKGEDMIKRIRQNLTSEKNGFFRYAKIDNGTGDGRAIMETERGEGIKFNNARE